MYKVRRKVLGVRDCANNEDIEKAAEPSASSHCTLLKNLHATAQELGRVRLPRGHLDRKWWEIGMDALNIAAH